MKLKIYCWLKKEIERCQCVKKIDSFKGLPIIVPYGTPQDEIDRFLKSGFEVIIGKKPEEDKNDNNKG